MIYNTAAFKKAKPIWEENKQKEQNHALRFETHLGKYENAVLRISGHTGYQVFINGNFIHWGPARAGRGHYRVDELNIAKHLTSDNNTVTVISTGYYCYMFEWLKEPSFMCAEIEADGDIICHTGSDTWQAYSCDEKVKKVQRYSFMRAFAEVYDMHLADNARLVGTEICEDKKFIEREISYPEFEKETYDRFYEQGSVEIVEPEKYFTNRAIDKIGETVDGFVKDQLEYISVHMAQRLSLNPRACDIKLPVSLDSHSYVAASMKINLTGFTELSLRCYEDTELYMCFDEILVDGKIDFTRNEMSNVIFYKLQGGKSYHLISAEPYTFKYINIISVGGRVELDYVGVIRTNFNKSEIIRSLNEEKATPEIKRIYNAALESFRQNTFDVFMDCPSRERAGWLCDGFFTARVEKLMSGKSTVEKCFLSNFAMEENYKRIPAGMLPMCYPAEFSHKRFIPNWAMWYLLELKEYLDRSGDRDLIDELHPKMQTLCEYFEKYENADGLLQNLDGWVFVEWSFCNQLVQNVNYPTNMLYYKFLTTMYELYGDEKHRDKAIKLRETIRRESRIGIFFGDNSVFNEENKLVLSGERTETCQYYAFFMGVATIEEDEELWNTLVRDFGFARKNTGKWPEIHPSNAFMGNYLRLELLSYEKIYDKLEADIVGYFDYMAKRTGTLWEHDNVKASCNHGFASHVLVWLDKLGYIV